MKPIAPQWDAPSRVRAIATTRPGGASQAPYASLNLGDHVGDDPLAVFENRARLRTLLPGEPLWLKQVHGTRVAEESAFHPGIAADACVARTSRCVCVVQTADCLPVLLCDRAGSVVAAAHAGWRGLAAGILEATIAAMRVDPRELRAWLGPAIGRQAYEVGSDVRQAFVSNDPEAAAAFAARGNDKWLCDLGLAARMRLLRAGVGAIFGGEHCTYREPQLFYSHRRDGVTGRMAALIWLED